MSKNMQIELYIDGEKKTFTEPVVPMLARRQYLEIESAEEEKIKENKNYITSAKKQLEEENEMLTILTDIIFNNQFTLEQLITGASDEYVFSKLREAVFGKPKEKSEEGNDQGK